MADAGAEELAESAPLSGDRAIAAREHDRLGRAGFAESLAQQVRTGGDGLVIALTGPWGSGKTSLLNLVEERLHAEGGDEPPPIVVRFNPSSVFHRPSGSRCRCRPSRASGAMRSRGRSRQFSPARPGWRAAVC